MHSAPSVSYPMGRSRDAARLLWIIWAVGACCAGAASYQFDSIGWRQGALLASLALAAMAVRRTLNRPMAGLAFDGQHWSFSGARVFSVTEATVALDLQTLLLVRLRSAAGASQWRWLERRADPQRWQDLRRALYARLPSAHDCASAAVP